MDGSDPNPTARIDDLCLKKATVLDKNHFIFANHNISNPKKFSFILASLLCYSSSIFLFNLVSTRNLIGILMAFSHSDEEILI